MALPGRAILWSLWLATLLLLISAVAVRHAFSWTGPGIEMPLGSVLSFLTILLLVGTRPQTTPDPLPEGDPFCYRCDYPLSGLARRSGDLIQCPECGADQLVPAIDPVNARPTDHNPAKPAPTSGSSALP